jgi:ribosomal protein S12 methylthiotransferase
MASRRLYLSPVACPKANVDLEKTSWLLRERGYEVVGSRQEGDILIVFSCGFIEDAKREAIEDILKAVDLKAKGEVKHVVVAGCLAEKYGQDLSREMPEVDAFIGNSWLGNLPAILQRLAEGKPGRKVWQGHRFANWAGALGRCPAGATPWTRTVMVCDGCNNACAYCSIPHMRGELRSRPVGEIIREIESLAAQGAKEIVLAGQDIACYGTDTGDVGLCDLVGQIAISTGAHWLRLCYASADNIGDRIGHVIREFPNVCNYIDLPIQHASPRILGMMGRKRGPEEVKRRILDLRSAVPDISIRTSVMVGFPGEEEEDFRLLLEFLRAVRFDMVGVFAFSPEPGTRAASLGHQVPDSIKQDRTVEILSLQADISRGRIESLVGREVEVLIEEYESDGRAVGRSQYEMAEVDRIIRVRDCQAPPGDFISARIEKCLGSYEISAIGNISSRP